MKQLTQQLKSGKMEILEVPFPTLDKGQILVHNHFSVISSGTEGKTVTDARKGYISKAVSRKKELMQVIEMIKSNGLIPTYKFVMNKLELPSSLGYSCAGEVIAIGEGVTNFSVGDYVACGGNSANHSEIVSIPVNLAVKVSKKIDLKSASLTTLAAIAIQGIRQSEATIGESCLIIGMGLIGQLTYLILESAGIRPIGIDISEDLVDFCLKKEMTNVFNRNQNGINEIVSKFSKGYGVDSVIITAASNSNDPIEFAGAVSRRKAKVVIVGAVPTGFNRENFYKKELELKMSCSYGPGRSSLNYEDKGYDYPIEYVRWTENRNMESFIDMLDSKRLNVDKLITHIFELKKSKDAYDFIVNRDEIFSAILIKYDHEEQLLKTKICINNESDIKPEDVNVGFIGAGNFAQGTLLPNMKNKCNFISILNRSGNTSLHVAKKYNFFNCVSDVNEIYKDKNINTVFITTRHNLHANQVIDSLKNNKNVYVEKPLAMNINELLEIDKIYKNKNHLKLMVGFNRRFSPAVADINKLFKRNQPKSIIIRVNAGKLPSSHWVNDKEIGGGRIIGELCHFIDLAIHLSGSDIKTISADSIDDSTKNENSCVVNLKMNNGSICSINYFSNGNSGIPKENIEVFCDGIIAIIDDFKTLVIHGKSKKKINYNKVDKGHQRCVISFINSIKNGEPSPICYDEIYKSTLATFGVVDSLRNKIKVSL